MTNRTNKIILFLLLICLLVIIFFYLKSNSKTSEIYFSKESGFYDDDFYLEIEGEGEIYYTLDGSIPTKQSNRYTAPIHIADASKNPNTNSMNKDVSFFFYESDDSGMIYEIPKYLIDKCNVIRAVSFLKGGKKTSVISASYFVGFKDKEEYQDIGIISLITDPKNLFDKKKGIYVIGQKIGDFNFNIKGKKSERIAHIDIFNQNKDLILQKEVGIRIHGRDTREYNPKSLNLYLRDKYDKTGDSFGIMLNEKYQSKELTLLCPSTDNTRIRDFLIMSLYSNQNVATMKFKPYLLFLDGEYWGFYYLTEKYNNDFISYYYNIRDKNNIIMVKVGSEKEKKFDIFEEVRRFMEISDFSKEQYYDILCNMIDIDSFIEYLSVLVYTARPDILAYNCGVWKTAKKTDNKFQNSKWRFMLYDMDDIGDKNYNIYDSCEIKIVYNLMNNKRFQEKFNNELIKLSKEDFEPTVVENLIRKNKEYIKKYVINDYKRFYGMNKQEGSKIFDKNIDTIISFFKSRPDKVLEIFKENQFNG